MALRAVPDHPKFARLKRILGFGKGRCLGYLEGVWHFAGRFAPHGDIGKYADEDIESWVEWEGEPGALIAALTTAAWLDTHETHRLVVHDWQQHADNATKLAVKRSGKPFVSTVSPQCADTDAKTPTPLRLPEPEPVPEPEPGGLPVLRVPVGSVKFDHGMVSQGVLMELGLSGTHLARNLSDVAKAEIARGADGLALMGQMAESGRQYLKAKGDARLSYPVGLEKFYGEGLWRDPKLWPWKDGYKPPSRAAPDPLEEQRRERQEALNEKRRLEGNGSEPA